MDSLRVLIIEDNLGDVRLLWDELVAPRGTGRLERVWAKSLGEALDLLQAGSFDAVVLDLGLPDSSGLDTLNMVQTQAPGVPVVVVTGLDDEALALQALQAGAQDYLVKGSASGKMVGRAVRYAVERKRTELVLARRASELQALYETSLEINAQVNLPSLLQSVVERAARLVDAPLGGLYMLRPDHETLRMDYIYNLPPEFVGTTLALGEGAAGRVAVSGVPFTVDNYQEWEGRIPAFAELSIQRTLCVPVKTGGEVIGVINVADNHRTETFSPEAIRLVSLFADQAAIAIQNARLYEQVQRLATIDALTGLYNRRGFFQLAERIFQLAHRSTNELVMIFIDIDHMKQINDQLGHSAGDQALVDAAGVLRSTFRVTDVLARVGGDEFAVLAYPSAEIHTGQLLKRLQVEIARFNTWAQRPFVLSLSAGCASWAPGRDETLDNLMARADEAMYAVKRQKV